MGSRARACTPLWKQRGRDARRGLHSLQRSGARSVFLRGHAVPGGRSMRRKTFLQLRRERPCSRSHRGRAGRKRGGDGTRNERRSNARVPGKGAGGWSLRRGNVRQSGGKVGAAGGAPPRAANGKRAAVCRWQPQQAGQVAKAASVRCLLSLARWTLSTRRMHTPMFFPLHVPYRGGRRTVAMLAVSIWLSWRVHG